MKKILFIFLFIFILGCVPIFFATSFVVWQIYAGNYADFEKSKIIDILSKETVLYYADGQSQLGSLFGQEHRIYVSVDLVPQVMKDAIVSAEDEDFYTNIGIDPKGILRAAVHNILFKTRQGASTITQQTVKNLFGRKETDIYIKFQEMINAFKLEKMYSKDQILEFYLNQFHVTGNGRGVGVAAKYYFNKSVEDLSLIEAAFIAGSVKAPEKYNPFTKVTVEGQERARNEALIRKNYVLNRMFKNHKITEQQLEESLKEPIPFNLGRFQFNELAVNQIISKQLARPEVLQAIGASSVDEVGTMGLHITTTLDKNIQNAAQYGLRQNLSRIQLILNGFSTEPSSNFINIQKPEEYGFYVGKIENIDRNEDAEKIKISFGIPTCVVNTDSINRVSLITDLSFRNGLKKSRDTLLSSLRIGQFVLASIKNITPEGIIFCDLEARPRVQGAVIVLDKGRIVAMAGGFSSSEYNRAVFAERQPGSSFKIPVFYAAQQLGWTILDPLSNMRDVFTWQGGFYFPRPDHAPSTLETTILGAGAKSENLASIWILRHLTDKLNYDQYLDLLDFLGITGNGMSEEQSLNLILNKFNVTPYNEYYLKSGILEKIKTELLSDLSVIGNNKLKVFLRTLHFGNGFEKQAQIISDNKELSPKEKQLRLNILKNNLLRFNKIAAQAKTAIETLKNIASGSAITEIDRNLILSFGKTEDGMLVFEPQDPWKPEITTTLVTGVNTTPLSIDALLSLIRSNSSVLNANNVLLDGVVPLSLIDTINTNLAKYWKDLQNASAFEKLFWNADFRYSLGMYYAANMANAMGIQHPLKWVQSFPLGSNDVTLSDLALIYQTFLTGKTYRYFNSVQPNQLVLIKRIEDLNGNLLWEAKAKEYQFADSFYSPPIMNVLRGSVTAGTAYVLNNELILRSNDEVIDKQLQTANIRIPVFGKTGTTNDYKNGTYIGFIPYPTSNGDVLSPENAYTIASYIGYDTNEPMIRKGYRVYGGGAIPAWQEIALSIIKNQNFAEKLNWQYWAEKKAHVVPFEFGSNLTQVIVPINSGISVSTQEPDDESSGQKNPYANDYSDTGKRLFRIYIAGSTSDNIFIPKRKVSFYSPVPPPQIINLNTNVSDASDSSALLNNNKPVMPEPIVKPNDKSSNLNEDNSPLNSADDDELPKAKEGSKNNEDDIPQAPPSLINH